MLPDRSLLIGQKLMENAKIENLKCDFLVEFQTPSELKNCLLTAINYIIQAKHNQFIWRASNSQF